MRSAPPRRSSHESAIPQLRRDLEAILDKLETELVAVHKALAALGSERSHRRPQRSTSTEVLAIVESDPGIRASMIALTTNLAVERVWELLLALEAAGFVQRQGLGWRSVRRSSAA